MDDPTNNKGDNEHRIAKEAEVHQKTVPVPDNLPFAQEPQITPYGKDKHKAPAPKKLGDTEQE